MKRKYFISIALALVMMTSLSAVAIAPYNSEKPQSKASVTAKRESVLEARFLNMLNHNFAYGEDLNTVEDLVNSSIPALLDMRDAEDDSFIAEAYVKDYLLNMYGVECEDFSDINVDFEQKEGYVYIIPRGFSVYNHTIDSVKLNEDRSYTVITTVSIGAHDEVEETAKAISLFVKNENSQFGFNIISSEIISDISNI